MLPLFCLLQLLGPGTIGNWSGPACQAFIWQRWKARIAAPTATGRVWIDDRAFCLFHASARLRHFAHRTVTFLISSSQWLFLEGRHRPLPCLPCLGCHCHTFRRQALNWQAQEGTERHLAVATSPGNMGRRPEPPEPPVSQGASTQVWPTCKSRLGNWKMSRSLQGVPWSHPSHSK